MSFKKLWCLLSVEISATNGLVRILKHNSLFTMSITHNFALAMKKAKSIRVKGTRVVHLLANMMESGFWMVLSVLGGSVTENVALVSILESPMMLFSIGSRQ